MGSIVAYDFRRPSDRANYRFLDFELRPQTFELRRGGETLRLQPRVFSLIYFLLLQRHRVVSHEELFEVLWPETCVSEDSLTYAVMAARKALGDRGNPQQIIMNVRSRGYRFVTPVDEERGPRSAPRSARAWHPPCAHCGRR